jgi:DNA-binding MarR family transcriptional regulator
MYNQQGGNNMSTFFIGEINNVTQTDLIKKIDYTKSSLKDRKEIIDDILDTKFHEEYFEKYFKVNINSGDGLSEQDSVCLSLEKMANYLLNSDESKEAKKEDHYVFYNDEMSFKKALMKEPNIEGMGNGDQQENVIHFLKNENRNYKTPKTQTISKTDYDRTDELGDILRIYRSYLKEITKELTNYKDSKLTRYKLSEISGSVRQDMVLTKDMLLGVFGYKSNASESMVVDWDFCDLTNPEHVKALLYMRPGYRLDEDLQYLIDEFVEKLNRAKPTPLQKEIVSLMRSNKGQTEIAETLNISKQRVNKNINMLVDRIVKVAIATKK